MDNTINVLDPIASNILSQFGEFAAKNLNLVLETFYTKGKEKKIEESKTAIEAAHIAVEYIKRRNGLPNHSIINILKALFKKAKDLAEKKDHKENMVMTFAKIISELDENELLVLMGGYRLTKKPDFYATLLTQNIERWVDQVTEESNLIYPELVEKSLASLMKKKLIQSVNPGNKNTFYWSGDKTLDQKKRNSLSALGYGLMDFTYTTIKDELDGK